jgi:hypothetical protein
MSSRERWTVYPLLFLTLGIALKDKVTRSVDTDQLVCHRLFVTDQFGNSQVVLGATPQGGLATMEGARHGVDVSVGHFSNQVSGLLITDANRKPIQGFLVPSTARVTTPRERRGAAPPSEQPRSENDPPAEPISDEAVDEPPQQPPGESNGGEAP